MDPIAKKSIKDVPQALKSLYQKAYDAKSKNNVKYAIELYKSALQKEPAFGDARDRLREIEKSAPPINPIKKIFNLFGLRKTITEGQIMVARKKYLEAMAKAEDALEIDIRSNAALRLLANAAENAGYVFVATEALELAVQFSPDDVSTLKTIADLYNRVGQPSNELRIRQKLSTLLPDDLDIQAAVRGAAAAATMEDNWQKGGSFRDSLKDSGEAKQLEQRDRVARNIDDIRELIDSMEAKLASEGESLDVVRKLGDLYQRGGDHDKALHFLHKVQELMGTLDPAVDRAIEKSEIGKLDASIKEWEDYLAANPDKEPDAKANIEHIQKIKMDYRLGRAVDRVQNYPNDLQLKFEYGAILWELHEIDDAIREFQQAQKNPNRRLAAIVYLARCFKEKGQLELAIEQFKRAIGEMLTMDRPKMEALYYLGSTYEAFGDIPGAKDCYKQIYMADSSFMDVAERYQKL